MGETIELGSEAAKTWLLMEGEGVWAESDMVADVRSLGEGDSLASVGDSNVDGLG